jgi:hypothetical protein
MKNYDRTDEDYFYGIKCNNVYRVEDDKVRCLNCTDDEDDQNDEDNETITITKNGVYYNDTVNGSNNDIKELKINKWYN